MYMYVYFLLATYYDYYVSALSVHRPKNHWKTWHLNYTSNETFISMFPYLNTLSICLKFRLELLQLSGLALETVLVKSHLIKIRSYRVTREAI